MTDPPTATVSTPKPLLYHNTPLDSPSLPNGKTRQSLTSSVSASAWTSPLAPTTFTSLLPIADGLLGTLAGLAESEGRLDGAEAGQAVVERARELFGSLEKMKTAALDLPGGHLSTERIEGSTQMMQVEADRKRAILRQLREVPMPIADQLQRSADAAGGEERDEQAEESVPKERSLT